MQCSRRRESLHRICEPERYSILGKNRLPVVLFNGGPRPLYGDFNLSSTYCRRIQVS